jgi:hypothetical protein
VQSPLIRVIITESVRKEQLGMHKLPYRFTVLLLAGALLAADPYPFAGEWKLDVAKSKFEGPIKPPKEQTIFIQEQGDQVVETVKGVAADGSPIFERHTHATTGGEVKVLEGASLAGISRVVDNRKAHARSSDMRIMRDGKEIATTHDVVSNDGKTIRTTVKGTDGQGKSFETVEFWDRM